MLHVQISSIEAIYFLSSPYIIQFMFQVIKLREIHILRNICVGVCPWNMMPSYVKKAFPKRMELVTMKKKHNFMRKMMIVNYNKYLHKNKTKLKRLQTCHNAENMVLTLWVKHGIHAMKRTEECEIFYPCKKVQESSSLQITKQNIEWPRTLGIMV